MSVISRRHLLTSVGCTASAAVLSTQPAEALELPDFTFVHITDTHIQPELRAKEGVRSCFNAIKRLPIKPDLVLAGGDLIMDAMFTEHKRSDMLYDLWQEETRALGLRMHYAIGNHDVYGMHTAKTGGDTHQDYGKKLYKRRLGLPNTYSVFDHRGWRFFCLDSIQLSKEGGWEGGIDTNQMNWIDEILRKTPKSMPIVFLTHVPIFTVVAQYTVATTAVLSSAMVVKNGKQFKEMIQGYNVKAVLQGHTHVVEEVNYLGVRYITGGAVCGEWWKGHRLGVHPEGFVELSVRKGELSWKYHSYGWKAKPNA